MEAFFTKRRVTFLLILVLLGFGVLIWVNLNTQAPAPAPIPVFKPTNLPQHEIIGQSIEGRNIEAYAYGTGTVPLLFVGGVHGGYEWNGVSLAYQFMDYLEANPGLIPKNLKLIIIPSLNPDGVFKATGKEGRFTLADVSTDKSTLESSRFNAQKVDLNRNFDCKWQPKSTWRSAVVNAGAKAFSEPETRALRDFVLKQKPVAAIFWHSQANTVYASECQKGILPETLKLVDLYAKASGYQATKTFDSYEITGDAEGWLASINIPAITVELKTHEAIEWDKNLLGIKAILGYLEKV